MGFDGFSFLRGFFLGIILRWSVLLGCLATCYPGLTEAQRRDTPTTSEDRDQVDSGNGGRRDVDLQRDEVAEKDGGAPSDEPDAEGAEPQGDGVARPMDVPGDGGSVPTAVSPQHISLPNAEGSITGMGESFAPVLSSGTATFSVPVSVPSGRGAAQPSLSLAYASTNGNGVVGIGWSFSTPFISRQTDRGIPRHDDRAAWHPDEDRFIYNGGQELVPVRTESMGQVDASGGLHSDAHVVPMELRGWQQYRARVEGGFLRFFRSPSGERWVVQGKDGTRFDFGRLSPHEGPPAGDLDSRLALESEGDDGSGRVHRWLLTRMSDANGNTVYYRYQTDRGARYLTDIFYTQPASCEAGGSADAQRACSASLSQYAFRIAFEYEARPDALFSYRAGWRIETARRLARITISAAEEVAGTRYFVRRYHLRYDGSLYHSLLSEVQVEGRPDTDLGGGVRAFSRVPESAIGGSASIGQLLPPMRFSYTRLPSSGPQVPGFGGVNNQVRAATNSPNVSLDNAQATLFDVNGDGLPDLMVTDPARHRTPSGDPAIGVHFNGFTGTSAVPAGEAAHFSNAIPVPVPPSLSNTMRLTTHSVRAMDVDGDGRGDFLHMPRLDRYGYFSFARRNATPSVSPLQQQWAVVYSQVRLEQIGGDPRIDLVNDGAHHRVLDVNGDGLIDVVRTTGTEMQTWLNLGFVPGGEGRFGDAWWDETRSRWVTTSEPIRTCLLRDGTTPVDFDDPEVRIADMNGDGIPDIVRMRRGRIVYWPGRGEGIWGEGPSDCRPTPSSNGAGRQLVMGSPPQDLDIDLVGVYLHDVDGDGAADLIQIGYNQVHIWFNRGGASFTERITIATPYAPSHSPNIAFDDLDGSGTTDLIYGRASAWEYIDLLGGVRPRLLTSIENGLGATTTIEYGSSADDYLADLSSYGHCTTANCDAFTWDSVVPGEGVSSQCPDGDRILYERSGECVYRSGGSPVISSVVRAVETQDNFNELGRELHTSRTEFVYHNGYYEGIEQEFRGFGAAEARVIGDASHPTSTTISWFHQGRRANDIATDRLAENPREALKGREYLTEIFDEAGHYLSTAHASLTVRRLMVGLDGRHVSYAFVHQSDEFRYSSAEGIADTQQITLPAVRFEAVAPNGNVPAGALREEPAQVQVRERHFAWLRSTTESVDNVGHVLRSTAHGRIKREEDVGVYAPMALAFPEAIVNYLTPVSINADGQWLWRTQTSHVSDNDGGPAFGRTISSYDGRGNLLQSVTEANLLPGTPSYDFSGSSQALSLGNQSLISSARYDAWGNAVASCGGANIEVSGGSACLRYVEVDYDDAYAQLPLSEAMAVGPSGPSCDRTSPLCLLEAHGVWERGLGLLVAATDVNGQTTEVHYDGLGRISAVLPPVQSDCPTQLPSHIFRYTLVPGGLPVSVVETETLTNAAFGECGSEWRATSKTYIDGLGRARATVARHNQLFGAHAWLRSGHSVYSKKGEPVVTFVTAESTSEPGIMEALALPTGEARATTTYDAFGRPIMARALHAPGETGAPTAFEYGALWTRTYDANDLGFGVPDGRDYGHMVGTPSLVRVDGHGRTIESIELLVQQGEQSSGSARYLRLASTYLPNGSVDGLLRAETLHADGGRAAGEMARVHDRYLYRHFVYDSAGRRIGTVDPDSMNHAETAGRANWRYLYNSVGDLVAVRDPRGCGQDFYYDHAGRLVGEEYVDCAEAQPSGDVADNALLELPAGSIGYAPLGAPKRVHVRFHFDALPGWASTLSGEDAAPLAPHPRGRATGVSDRAQRSAVAYDERGNPIWTARQMAALPAKSSGMAYAIAGEDPLEWTASETFAPLDRTYDASTTYVVRSRFDHLGRPYEVTLPNDPDWNLHGNTGPAPTVRGVMLYSELGLPSAVVFIDGNDEHLISALSYDRFLQPIRIVHGYDSKLVEELEYDVRQRPTRIEASRPNWTPPSIPSSSGLAELIRVVDHRYAWDEADNLIMVENAGETPATLRDGYRPARQRISHDSLYRVTNVFFEYRQDGSPGTWGTDTSSDWRSERTRLNADMNTHDGADPMRMKPASMVSPLPPERVNDLVYEYDWLANMVSWDDDGTEGFYERKIGQITNGGDDAYLAGADGLPATRPSALYLAADLPSSGGAYDPSVIRGGWLEVRYGVSGNVTGMVVRGDCRDASSVNLCHDSEVADINARKAQLLEDCSCQSEQYYAYGWDELNRLSEARRYDRSGGHGSIWHGMVRQRYRYDASNQRLVKQTLDASPGLGEPSERVHLYVYPGRFERSGVITDGEGTGLTGFVGSAILGSETHYTVGGARAVRKSSDSLGPLFAPERRLTYAVKDVIQSTSAVVDLISGELLELTTFYPNGARETHRTQGDASVQLELNGFTGKEADEEVGVVYFGERYLIPRIGRWASPDPLAIHAAGGGEALNAYHYVSGNLLQARDPVGLESEDRPTESGGGTSAPVEVNTAPEGIRYGQEFVMVPGAAPEGAERIAKNTYLAPQSTLESLKERGASAYIYNPDAPLSLEEARYVEALPPSLARDFMQALAIFRGELTRSVESLPGVRGVRGGGNPEGSDSDAVYVVALAAQAASAVGPPAIARAAKAAMKAVKAAIAAAKEKVALTRAGRAALDTAIRRGDRLLPAFSRSTVMSAIESSRASVGQTSQGARGLAKKLGHSQRNGVPSAFDGIAPTQENAELLIDEILSHPASTVVGRRTLDAFNASGQGVRIEAHSGRFITFLEESLRSR